MAKTYINLWKNALFYYSYVFYMILFYEFLMFLERIVLLNCFFLFFIHLKLELLTQIDASNAINIYIDVYERLFYSIF